VAGLPITLEELLVRHGAIADEQLAHAREEQAKWGGDLGRTLVDLGYITEELLLRAVAHQQRIPWVAPSDPAPAAHLSSALSLQLCERFGVITVAADLRARVLRVATADPTNELNLRALATASGFSIQPAAAMQEWVDRAIRTVYYGEEHLPVPEEPVELPEDPPPLVEAEPVHDLAELAELRARLDRLEAQRSEVVALGKRVAQLEARKPGEGLAPLTARVEQLEVKRASPELASLMARLERLEQLGIEDSRAVRIISGVLVDLGFITRAELQQRLKK
jgi:hypothetical protein